MVDWVMGDGAGDGSDFKGDRVKINRRKGLL
jgi:hypothetical protein